ncbi:TPA_asm: hypothetical protein [Rhodiola rosea amalgavirus 1]|nr:TPA_asm: hypothetical protein [Rhodiola rosea amalgavirus 1]
MAFNQANAETAAQGAARNLRARGGGEDVIARAYLGGEDDGRPIGGILTPAQHTLRIQDALQPLAEAGVVIGQFTYQQVVACGYSPDSFIKLVRTLTGHNDDAILKSCLSLGVKRDLYDLPSDITVATLIKLCNYLRSPPGQAALQDKQRTLKLAKKGKGVLPPRDVAMTSVLQIQLQDLANRVKQQRAKDDAELAAIRERYALKEREREANTLRIKKSVSPAYRWVEPSNNDINTKSYDLYAQWCETNGYQALPPGPDGWAVAVKQFGEQVKAEIMAEFCADEKRQRKLTKYLKAKILELDEKGDRRQSGIYRNYLANISGEALLEDAFTTEDPSVEANTGGDADEAGGDGQEQNVVSDVEPGRPRKKGTARRHREQRTPGNIIEHTRGRRKRKTPRETEDGEDVAGGTQEGDPCE